MPYRLICLSLAATAAVSQEPTPRANIRYGDIAGQDARRYDIRLRVDVEHGRLSGDIAYTFTAVEPLAAIRLDAKRSDEWKVAFHTDDGRELEATWDEDRVSIALPAPVGAGETITFGARIEGLPVDGFYFADNRYGERLAFTDHYSIRAHGWLPCEDNPADRAVFHTHLCYPEGTEAIGFGAPSVPTDDAPDGYRCLDLDTTTEIPPYMYALVIGPFARVPEKGDPRIADHLVYRKDAEKARRILVHDAEWLATMEKTFGPYPFGKYTTVQCPTRWGGFEAPGNVQLAEALFDDERRGTATLAHELVHMWFGDGVGYAEWREVWLAEGFASYFGPWLHARVGGPSLQANLRAMRAGWLRSFEGRTKSIRDDHFPHPDQALNSNTYPKGAWVLHMLRGELGDEEFFAALKAYFTTFRGRSVRTEDFVGAVEKSCGQDLHWFFEQWLDRIGCPELKVTLDGQSVVVEQVQKGEPYRFWLRIATDTGEEHRIRIDRRRHEVRLEAPASELRIDPGVELLFRPAH